MNKKLKGKIVERFGTQSDFAHKIGVDESVVSRVVRERIILDSKIQKKWARVLKCRAEELFG